MSSSTIEEEIKSNINTFYHYISQNLLKVFFYDHCTFNKHCSIQFNPKLNIGKY